MGWNYKKGMYNQLLKDDNACLRNIINNDSSNTSRLPSTDQKGGRPANAFNGRKKTERKAGVQKGHAGITLTKAEIEKKIASGRCRHEIRTVGRVSGQDYVTKYAVNLNVEPVITEIRIYADENGDFPIPVQYRSDVTYGGNVKALAVSLYSEGVMSNDRIAAFLNAAGNGELDLSGCQSSPLCPQSRRLYEVYHLFDPSPEAPRKQQTTSVLPLNRFPCIPFFQCKHGAFPFTTVLFLPVPILHTYSRSADAPASAPP